MLVESKDKLGNMKPHICLDPTNLNKTIIQEPYHFRTPEDIAHLLVDACIITTVARDVFKHKLHQCFGMIKQVIVITDGIMIVGKQQNHRDHDLALTTLLDPARKCSVRLKFDKLQYKKTEVDFFGETYTTSGCKPAQSKVSAIIGMAAPTCKKQLQLFIVMINNFSNSPPDCQSLQNLLGNFPRTKYLLIGVQNTKRLSNR